MKGYHPRGCPCRGRVVTLTTFAHHSPNSFTPLQTEAYCHLRGGSVRSEARLGRRRGGPLQCTQQCRGRSRKRTVRSSETLETGLVARHESILEPGGAAVPGLAIEAERVDCQVPSRCLCLSQRGGAAGPEWSLAPRTHTLALGQRLGQRFSRIFVWFGTPRVGRAEPTRSKTPSGCRGFDATPVRFGAVAGKRRAEGASA